MLSASVFFKKVFKVINNINFMKKIISIGLLILLILSMFAVAVSALDEQTNEFCGGDDESKIRCSFGDEENSFYGSITETGEDGTLPEKSLFEKIANALGFGNSFVGTLIIIFMCLIILCFLIFLLFKERDEEENR